MPRQELTATQEEKMVDLDVSGPAIDVELPQDGAVLTEVAQETQESVPVVEVQDESGLHQKYKHQHQQR